LCYLASAAGQEARGVDHFLYRDGALWAEDVPLAEIAAAVGTPAYVYSAATLERHYRLFDDALAWGPHLVCFAMKANSNLAVVKLLGDLGAGAWTWSARASIAGRGPRAFPGTGSCFPAWARQRRDARGFGRRHPAVQCGERART
jgi:hypothetical protein